MSSDTEVRPTTHTELVHIRQIADIGLDDVLSVGGKNANPGELTRCGLPVPVGFVVTAEAFVAALDAAGCRDELADQTVSAPTMTDADLDRFAETARAPSDHPDFAEFRVSAGIDSISVDPDVASEVRQRVAAAERRIMLSTARAGSQ